VSGRQIPWAWRPRIGAEKAGIRSFVSVRTFLRVLGSVYFIAFTSFGVESPGLIGSRGILPFADYLRAARETLGSAAYWELPTLLWLHPGDGALAAVWLTRVVFSLAAVCGFRQRTALAVCLVLWLSLCSVGQDFLSFQWDILLLETGFLAVFAGSSRIRVLLFRWLLFRLMFFSGAVIRNHTSFNQLDSGGNMAVERRQLVWTTLLGEGIHQSLSGLRRERGLFQPDRSARRG